jgi:hypothetical protein
MVWYTRHLLDVYQGIQYTCTMIWYTRHLLCITRNTIYMYYDLIHTPFTLHNKEIYYGYTRPSVEEKMFLVSIFFNQMISAKRFGIKINISKYWQVVLLVYLWIRYNELAVIVWLGFISIPCETIEYHYKSLWVRFPSVGVYTRTGYNSKVWHVLSVNTGDSHVVTEISRYPPIKLNYMYITERNVV